MDAGTGTLSETKSANGDLGDLKHADIVSDGTNNAGNLLLLVSAHVDDDLRERHGGNVGLRHVETLEDGLVEVGRSTTGKEAVDLGLLLGKSSKLYKP